MIDISCRLCKTPSLQFMYVAKGYDICKCSKCNLVQIGNNPTDEELNRIYSKTFFSKGKFANDMAFYLEAKRRIKQIYNVVEHKDIVVLDYGCATGDFLKIASDHFNIYGTDFSLDAIQEAMIKYPELKDKFFSMSEQSMYNKRFDIITAWDVIEHSRDPMESLHSMLQMLKPNGYLMFSTPNFGTLSAKFFKEKWAFMIPPEHICFFDKKTIQMLLKEYEYSLIEWKSVGKWVNFGFLLYKLRQSFGLIPQFIITLIQKTFMKKICFYIPTGDIQYMTFLVKGKK